MTLTIKQCKSEITKSPSDLDTNRTTSTGPVIVNRDEDDEIFIPYQGERFNIFDWALFRVISVNF